ncbi:MAG: squalene--hopene cyclase [Planctomycetes bacterium]|nr:squalene--hopene cyclase [Planctomycetota bacterium]
MSNTAEVDFFVTPSPNEWLRSGARAGARRLVRYLTDSLSRLASAPPAADTGHLAGPEFLQAGSAGHAGSASTTELPGRARHAAGHPPEPTRAEALERGIAGARAYLLRTQHPEGYWFEACQADSTLTSEYIMLRHFLGNVDAEKQAKAARWLLRTQKPEGGWPIYEGGPNHISTTVKAYFALKLAGYSKDHPALARARAVILDLGGLTQVNVFTKIALALFGQYDWRGVPTMPPEIVFLPDWFYFNMYDISYWSRTVLTPLLILFAKRPLKPLPPELGVAELLDRPRGRFRWGFAKDRDFWTWKNFFVNVDALLKAYECVHPAPLRRAAVERCKSWMIERMQGSGGLGAIYPAMANSVMALHCLGYSLDHPLVAKAFAEVEALEIHAGDEMWLQPCHSPVWDTPLTMNALAESGVAPDDPALVRGAEWLISKQCSQPGDWTRKAPRVESGGWYFQFENEKYPDTDDTPMVMVALTQARLADDARRAASLQRGLRWLLGMQSSNGGFGAFDIDNTKLLLNNIPFADHGALLDPPTVDVTGRVLDILGRLGYDGAFAPARRAIEFIKSEQESFGAWYGRWGVNYLYGTWSAISGLRAIGEDMGAPYIGRALDWLRLVQNLDGGWGESCASYEDRRWAGRGRSTASQTAWALLAFLRAGVEDDPALERGVRWLTARQRADGAWDEPEYTGTGFPRVFYLRYHMYSKYFPLWALSMYRKLRAEEQDRAPRRQV